MRNDFYTFAKASNVSFVAGTTSINVVNLRLKWQED